LYVIFFRQGFEIIMQFIIGGKRGESGKWEPFNMSIRAVAVVSGYTVIVLFIIRLIDILIRDNNKVFKRYCLVQAMAI